MAIAFSKKRLITVAGVLALAMPCLANAQTASAPARPPAAPNGSVAPIAPVVKFPLRIANYGSKPVEAWIDGGLKCKLPAGYQCNLEVPGGRHSIHLARPGSVYNDAFTIPDIIAGKKYDGGAYLIKDDRVDYSPMAAR